MPKTKVEKEPVEKATNGHDDFNKQVTDTAESLLKGCSRVTMAYSWFGTTAKIDDETLSEMMGGMVPQEIRSAISASKRLLKSRHEALVGAKQAFQAVKDYVKGMTIPSLALADSAGAGADEQRDQLRKEAGVRLVQKVDMTIFKERLDYLIGVLRTSVEKLQKALPAIKAEDKVRLDKINPKLFRDHDYPQDVTKLVAVGYKFSAADDVDPDWETLCPEVYALERSRARQKFEAVVENAAVEFAKRFVEYVRLVVEQLGNRVRLNPKPDSLLWTATVDDKDIQVNVADAEVKTLVRHEHDEEVPDGYVLLELRLQKAGKGRSTEVWLKTPITEKAYTERLRPYETDQRKKLYTSTIDNLKAELEAFVNVGEMLGPYKKVIENSVTKVKDELTKASGNLNSDQIGAALREGTYFRNTLKGVMEGVAHSVQASMGEAYVKRRKISKKLMGNV